MKSGLIFAGLALLLTGCSKNIDTTEAVKQGVIRDLSKKVDINNMDVNVSSVSFRGNEADALVAFAPKGSGSAQGMTMRYTLEKQSDGWHIKKRQGDLSQHALGANGTGDPHGGQPLPGEGGQQQLPEGHPPVGATPQR